MGDWLAQSERDGRRTRTVGLDRMADETAAIDAGQCVPPSRAQIAVFEIFETKADRGGGAVIVPEVLVGPHEALRRALGPAGPPEDDDRLAAI